MTELVGLPPLPPHDAARVGLALGKVMTVLETCRAILDATPDDVPRTQWTRELAGMSDRAAARQALLVPAMVVYYDRERGERGLRAGA